MKATLHVVWVVFKVSVVLAIAVVCFAAILMIGLERYSCFISLGTLLGMGMLLAWQAGIRCTLMVLGAWPVLLIRHFPLVIVAVFVVPLLLSAMVILSPLILFQMAIYHALE